MNVIFLSIGISNFEEHTLYTDLLSHFRDRGHSVYVVCQRERRFGVHTELIKEQGLHVLHVKTGNITKTNLIEKGLTTLLIGLQFRKAIDKYFPHIKFDLILYTTPPITIVNTVQHLKKRDQAFSYLILKDIFPQNAIDIGILKKTGWRGIVAKFFRYKEKKLYTVSDVIGCMSNANATYLKKHYRFLDDTRVEICPNTITPSMTIYENSKILRDNFKLPQDKIIFICGGNFGKPQDVAYIIEVLKSNEKKSDRHFVMCGSGTEFYRLKAYAKGNTNRITVLDSISNQEYNQLLAACDIGLIFLDHRFTIPNFPSRLLDYMNHNMPVLAATDKNTDLGKVIESGNFGWWCESKEVSDFDSLLDEICANPLLLEEKSKNSRTFLENNYDTKIAYERIMHAYINGRENE